MGMADGLKATLFFLFALFCLGASVGLFVANQIGIACIALFILFCLLATGVSYLPEEVIVAIVPGM